MFARSLVASFCFTEEETKAWKGEQILVCLGQFNKGGMGLDRSPSSPSLLSPESCVSKGRGQVCRAVGRTVPGCVLSVLHVGLGDKYLFFPAPSHALPSPTHTHSRDAPTDHTYTYHRARLSQPQTFHIRSPMPGDACDGPILLGWVLPHEAQNMHVTLSLHSPVW